jgi:hypothetical protein
MSPATTSVAAGLFPSLPAAGARRHRSALADKPHPKIEGPTTDQRGFAPLLQLDAFASAVRHQHADAMCRASDYRAIIR